jgi:hypothetical protein
MTDKLNTCMICEQEFKEDENVVVVYDATYQGFTENNEIASFNQNVDVAGYICPERAVYCNNCWSSLVVHSWNIVKEKRCNNLLWND